MTELELSRETEENYIELMFIMVQYDDVKRNEPEAVTKDFIANYDRLKAWAENRIRIVRTEFEKRDKIVEEASTLTAKTKATNSGKILPNNM